MVALKNSKRTADVQCTPLPLKNFVSAVGTGVPDGPKQTLFGCKPAMLKKCKQPFRGCKFSPFWTVEDAGPYKSSFCFNAKKRTDKIY